MSPRTDEELAHAQRGKSGRCIAVPGMAALLVSIGILAAAPSASASTYPMYQCVPGLPAVSPGWTVFGNMTSASTVLSNTCSAGGSIGDYVFTNGQAGAVTEAGSNGSQVGLRIDVPGSAPDVTIQSIKARVIGSAVTGDDAFLEFAAAGQSLSGAAELPYGGVSDYSASASWTLPEGARDFEAYVNCSTDRSSPTCEFANSISVPALTDITLILEDNTAPRVTSASGPLVTAAAADASVAGSQSISFTSADADSGVRTAALTVSPLSGGSPYVHSFDFSSQCSYAAWNGCPLAETVSGFGLNTTALPNGAYALNLAVTDAAGNVTDNALGSITVNNPAAAISSLGALPGPGESAGVAQVRGVGAPNGTPASESAYLQLGMRRAILRTYAKRALRITGRLLNAQGQPIAGATVDVLQQAAGPSRPGVIGQAKTNTSGTFVVAVSGGPSRTIELAYRAFSADSDYSTTEKISESVGAGVKLAVNPRRTGSEGTIRLSGRVLGAVPARGVVVELLVHYRGQWEPFRTPRTDSRGRFHVAYQFQGAVGRFPFRALAFGGQADFPYVTGESGTVDVTTG